MKVVLVGLLAALAGLLSGVGFAQTLQATADGSQIVVAVDGHLFTCYKFAANQKYPYFFPVNGPASQTSVTTETSDPYPHHHSLFFGCDKVFGAGYWGNYWQEANDTGQILSQGPKIEAASGDAVVFTDECLWKRPDKEPILRDTRRVVITAPRTGLRLIDFEITLMPLTDVQVQQTNHSLFSGRMAPALSVASGGTLVNAEGLRSEAGTFGVASPWCAYYGTRDGVTEGMAIFQHPENRWYPCKWFTRDYGFFSPAPMYWLESGKLDLPRGEPLTLRYRVIVFSGAPEAAGIAQLFEEYRTAAADK